MKKKQKGQFIVTGSQQLDLQAAVTQSLAGRTAIISLLPLSIDELLHEKIDLDVDTYLYQGFLPDIYSNHLNPTEVYRNYVGTYLERDLRNISKVHDLSLFQKFLKLCAGRVGCLLDQASLANDVGVSATTIHHWLSILEASYLIFRISPYYENFGKRVIKTPKLYFFDVGLVSYLLGIENQTQLSRDPLRGHVFENLVVMECMKARFNQGKDANLYYYRDSNHNGVDLIYKSGHQLIPIEIKSAESANDSFVKPLKHFQSIAQDRVPNGYVVYAGHLEYNLKGFELKNYKYFDRVIAKNEF